MDLRPLCKPIRSSSSATLHPSGADFQWGLLTPLALGDRETFQKRMGEAPIVFEGFPGRRGQQGSPKPAIVFEQFPGRQGHKVGGALGRTPRPPEGRPRPDPHQIPPPLQPSVTSNERELRSE